MPVTQEKRCCVVDLRGAFFVDWAVVKEHAKWWDPGMEAHWDAAHASPLGGVDAAISIWAADQCNKPLAQGLAAGEGEMRGALVNAAKERGLAARKRFKFFEPVSAGAPFKAIADTHRALTWRLVESKNDV